MADAGDRHDGHDPLRIAALLDPDLDPDERSSAEALVATCGECAALYADLRALSVATAAAAAPARSRDFRLSPADAARLSVPAGEPRAAATRLTGKMPDPATTAVHATHDTLLVAALADRSPTAAERVAGEALVAACSLCATLLADTAALVAATRAMPAPARPRDYSLTPADAARLRPGGWRRWVAAFGSTRDIFSRPLAVGLTTLGLAGLLVVSVPSVFQGSAASGPSAAEDSSAGGASRAPALVTGGVPDVATGASGPSGAPVPAAPGALAPGPTAAATSNAYAAAASPPMATAVPAGALGDRAAPGSSPTAQDATKEAGGRTNDVQPNGAGGAPASAAPAVSAPVVLSGALLLAGLGLFLLRWAARRSRR